MNLIIASKLNIPVKEAIHKVKSQMLALENLKPTREYLQCINDYHLTEVK